jgi:hypothetical protein
VQLDYPAKRVGEFSLGAQRNPIGIKLRGISPDRGGIIIAQGIALGTQTP